MILNRSPLDPKILTAIAVILAAVVFFVDLSLHLGVPSGVPYVVLVMNRMLAVFAVWPLSDFRPGGRAYWSDGSLAAFAQVCRTKRGNVSVL